MGRDWEWTPDCLTPEVTFLTSLPSRMELCEPPWHHCPTLVAPACTDVWSSKLRYCPTSVVTARQAQLKYKLCVSVQCYARCPYYPCPEEASQGPQESESWKSVIIPIHPLTCLACHSLGIWEQKDGVKGALSFLAYLWGSCVLQSVVVPRCRGTAEALQITVAHILGDAGSPYLTGLVRSV